MLSLLNIACAVPIFAKQHFQMSVFLISRKLSRWKNQMKRTEGKTCGQGSSASRLIKIKKPLTQQQLQERKKQYGPNLSDFEKDNFEKDNSKRPDIPLKQWSLVHLMRGAVSVSAVEYGPVPIGCATNVHSIAVRTVSRAGYE